MKDNMDRIIGGFLAGLLVLLSLVVLANFNWSLMWFGSAAVTAGLGVWFTSGSRTVEVGWKGLLLFLGERMKPPVSVGEGWHWVPFPFNLKLADCRETSAAIDPLTVLTADNIQVEISGTLVSKIINLGLYFNVDPKTIKQGIDDTWDEIIRTQVVVEEFDAVRKMHLEVGESAKAALEVQATSAWGIEVIRIPVTIRPKTAEVASDLELQAREKMQKRGQATELKHFAEQVIELMKVPPDGPGLSREQAVEQVQLSLGRISKVVDAKTIAVDEATAKIIAAVFGRKA